MTLRFMGRQGGAESRSRRDNRLLVRVMLVGEITFREEIVPPFGLVSGFLFPQTSICPINRKADVPSYLRTCLRKSPSRRRQCTCTKRECYADQISHNTLFCKRSLRTRVRARVGSSPANRVRVGSAANRVRVGALGRRILLSLLPEPAWRRRRIVPSRARTLRLRRRGSVSRRSSLAAEPAEPTEGRALERQIVGGLRPRDRSSALRREGSSAETDPRGRSPARIGLRRTRPARPIVG